MDRHLGSLRELKRLPEWAENLAELVDEHRDTPLEFGKHDCIIFAAMAVLVMTGFDVSYMLPGGYDSRLGVARILKEATPEGTLRAAINKELGPGYNTVVKCRRGDLTIHKYTTESLAVCLGERVAFPTGEGLDFRPLTECVGGWPVG